MLGIRQLVVVVNKMDLAGYDEARFREIEQKYRKFLEELGLEPLFVIPASAKAGENIAAKSKDMSWFEGPTLLEALDNVANTTSVYGAFLKEFKASARRPLELLPLDLTDAAPHCVVHNLDANQLIEEIECDVLYLDPPYNQRQYGANDAFLATDPFNPRRATVMVDYTPSEFSRFRLQYAQSKTLPDITDNELFLQYILTLGAHPAHKF